MVSTDRIVFVIRPAKRDPRFIDHYMYQYEKSGYFVFVEMGAIWGSACRDLTPVTISLISDLLIS